MPFKGHEKLRKTSQYPVADTSTENEESGEFEDHDTVHKSFQLLSWIRMNWFLLLMCSLAALLLVFHRLAYRGAGFHMLSDSLHDTVVAANDMIHKQQQLPLHLRRSPSTSTESIKHESLVLFQTQLTKSHEDSRAKSSSTSPPSSLPFEGCLDSLPYPDTRSHIVPPPAGNVTLVCCQTTAGILNFEVHPSWAPNGAARFLQMVDEGFFSTQVPLFRALKGFLVQFGLAGNVSVQQRFHSYGNLRDDPPWLPLGPSGREIEHITRYQKGYLSYAGAGPNSRGTQLILALADNLYLGGGSPWEVPIGQAFGEASFATIDRIYTGYGEQVSQGKIMNQGLSYVQREFPRLDIVQACVTVRREVAWTWTPETGRTNLHIPVGLESLKRQAEGSNAVQSGKSKDKNSKKNSKKKKKDTEKKGQTAKENKKEKAMEM